MIWIGAILFSFGVLLNIVAADCDLKAIVIVGTILVTAGTMIFVEEDSPTAMDVYQGKTTLVITYKDGVPVDSIVVLKNK